MLSTAHFCPISGNTLLGWKRPFCQLSGSSSLTRYFRRSARNHNFRNLGTTPILKKKTLLEWQGHSRSNSRNSRAFSEQFLEWHSRPNLCENPILGATLGATLGIGWTPKFQPKFSQRFFQNWGGSRAPDHWRNNSRNAKFNSENGISQLSSCEDSESNSRSGSNSDSRNGGTPNPWILRAFFWELWWVLEQQILFFWVGRGVANRHDSRIAEQA